MEDAAAVTAFHSGDATAFQLLFDRHATHVYRTAFLIVLDRERAEYIVQETFLTLFQHLPRLVPGPVGSWLDRVAVNLRRLVSSTTSVLRGFYDRSVWSVARWLRILETGRKRPAVIAN